MNNLGFMHHLSRTPKGPKTTHGGNRILAFLAEFRPAWPTNRRLFRRTGWFCFSLLICANAHATSAAGTRIGGPQVPDAARVLFDFTPDSLTAYWPPIPEATSYKLYAGPAPGNYPIEFNTGSNNLFTVPLAALGSGPYYVLVRAFNGTSSTAIGPEVALTPPITPFSATGGEQNVTLSWNPVPGAMGYTLLYGYAPGDYTGALPLGNRTSFNLPTAGLPNAAYYGAVSVKTAAGERLSNEVRLLQSVHPVIDQTSPDTQAASAALAEQFNRIAAEFVQANILLNSVAMADTNRMGWKTLRDRYQLANEALGLLIRDADAFLLQNTPKTRSSYQASDFFAENPTDTGADKTIAPRKESPPPPLIMEIRKEGFEGLKTNFGHAVERMKSMAKQLGDSLVAVKNSAFDTAVAYCPNAERAATQLGNLAANAGRIAGGLQLMIHTAWPMMMWGAAQGAELIGVLAIGSGATLGSGGLIIVIVGAMNVTTIVFKDDDSADPVGAFEAPLMKGLDNVVAYAATSPEEAKALAVSLAAGQIGSSYQASWDGAGAGTKITVNDGQARIEDSQPADFRRNSGGNPPLLPGEYTDSQGTPFEVPAGQDPAGADFVRNNLPGTDLLIPQTALVDTEWPAATGAGGESCAVATTTQPPPVHIDPGGGGCTCCCGGVPAR